MTLCQETQSKPRTPEAKATKQLGGTMGTTKRTRLLKKEKSIEQSSIKKIETQVPTEIKTEKICLIRSMVDLLLKSNRLIEPGTDKEKESAGEPSV